MSVVTKRSTPVAEFEHIAETVFGAVRESAGGRPRPVHVELPIDLLAETGSFEAPSLASGYRPSPTREQVTQAAELLANASKPLIYVGGGAAEASAAVTELAEMLGAPVICSIMGKGIVSEDHPYGLGHAWDPWGRDNPADELLAACDVILVVGSKLGAQETNYWKMPLPATMIRVDIDADELNLNYPNPTLAIQADAGSTADALVEALRQRGSVAPKTPAEEIEALRQRIRSVRQDETFYPYVAALRDGLPRDGVIVQDMTMMSYRMNDAFPAFHPRSYLFPSSYGTLGFSVPAAIGAKIGRPDTPVVAVVGDGGFQFTMQELATAIQFEVSLPIVIFNDSTYTAVEQAMKYEFSGRTMATDLINPDYVKLADAYGIPGARADSPSAMATAVQNAFERRGPSIIDVPIPRM
jgi:acetolactate synthase-1/2/3 large subunit